MRNKKEEESFYNFLGKVSKILDQGGLSVYQLTVIRFSMALFKDIENANTKKERER